MGEPEPMMARIAEAGERGRAGDREAHRSELAEIWNEIGADAGDPLHRCAIAHAMADLQERPSDELRWDLKALVAAGELSDERAAEAGIVGGMAGFYPSLHLNIGECYRKLGQADLAREHVKLGEDAAVALSDDGYGRMVRMGLQRLSERLAAGVTAPTTLSGG